jgi:uncharacterized repeat protein (TIGR02543 family)
MNAIYFRILKSVILLITLFLMSCMEDAEKIQSIKKEKITGLVQKGPFVSGTSILMNELNSQLSQTGKIFTSQISNDLGLFEISNIELNSSFVEFTASGFYFNEVSGIISISSITLNTLSDISDKTTINVNILTHLEKRRVESLIKQGKSFIEAKKQAKGEILSIFSISLDNNSDFEDFDISKNNEEGGILLAVSIILQGNRSVGELTELLSKIQSDISSDGNLDDETILNSLRISTLTLDLEKIRENVEARYRELNINSIIPDFEKHIYKFLSYKDYPLSVSIEGEGTVEERVVSTPSGREFPYRTVIELTPVPKEGWIFDSWGGDLSGSEIPQNIIIDGEKNVIARFKRRDYPLNLTIVGEGTIDERIVSNPQGREYPFETVVELTPIAKEGWVFDSWDGDLTGTDSPKTITVDKEKNVTVKFRRKDYSINFTIVGEGTVEERIVTNPQGRQYPFETIVELTPVAEGGWIFERWEGDLQGNKIPETLLMGDEKNVTVVFRKPIFRLSENGVTCICENVKPGEKGFINGIEYEAVDNNLIRKRRDEGADMTKLCTSFVTDLGLLFYETTFNQPIGNWDVSNVRNMSLLFANTPFNQPLEFWDVKNVTNMDGLFAETLFNRPIAKWDVSKVTDMHAMFAGTPFNQPIGDWNVSNVRDMASMFVGTPFNQPIGNWNVGNVVAMNTMFYQSKFNQPIGNWDVSKVTNMRFMFANSPFNHPLGNWDVSKVNTMEFLFSGTSFNHPLGNWDVSNVTNMHGMFAGTPFNHSIENWDVSNVRNMNAMFTGTPFNHSIENWDVSNVMDMREMFNVSSFNQPLGKWDVSNVRFMGFMFNMTPFNQDISNWCVIYITSEPEFFSNNAPLTSEKKPVWGSCPD